MMSVDLPIRRDRATYRNDLAGFQTGPRPFLSLYLDVRRGEARRGVGLRLQAALDSLVGDDLAPSAIHRTAARDALALIEDDDATLVALVDAAGRTLVTGYPSQSGAELVLSTERPVVGPLLAAEQALVHHIVAGVNGAQLLLRTTPRHGEPSKLDLDVDSDREVVVAILQAAEVSRTALVVLCGPRDRVAALGVEVRSGLPAGCALAELAVDGLDPDDIVAAIGDELRSHVARRNDQLLALWGAHLQSGQAVQGAAVSEAIIDEDVGLLLVDRSVIIGGPLTSRAAMVEELIRTALGQGHPVHLVDGAGGVLTDGLGAITRGSVDPELLASLLER